jgi:hypothetical protein
MYVGLSGSFFCGGFGLGNLRPHSLSISEGSTRSVTMNKRICDDGWVFFETN